MDEDSPITRAIAERDAALAENERHRQMIVWLTKQVARRANASGWWNDPSTRAIVYKVRDYLKMPGLLNG